MYRDVSWTQSAMRCYIYLGWCMLFTIAIILVQIQNKWLLIVLLYITCTTKFSILLVISKYQSVYIPLTCITLPNQDIFYMMRFLPVVWYSACLSKVVNAINRCWISRFECHINFKFFQISFESSSAAVNVHIPAHVWKVVCCFVALDDFGKKICSFVT